MTAPTTIPTADTAPAAPQNLFGICARVGQDFGFDPLWLRLVFAGVLILDPVAVIAAYFALGAIVLSSRLLFPDRRPAAAEPAAVMPLAVGARRIQPELPLAA